MDRFLSALDPNPEPPPGYSGPIAWPPMQRPEPTPSAPRGTTTVSGFQLPELITPYNTEEFWNLTDAYTKHASAVSKDIEAIAVDLRKLLANPAGTKMPALRADLKLNARRVSRHIAHAAALQEAAGKAFRMGWVTYLNLYAEAPKASGRTFNVN